jgi:hypothetical protein
MIDTDWNRVWRNDIEGGGTEDILLPPLLQMGLKLSHFRHLALLEARSAEFRHLSTFLRPRQLFIIVSLRRVA